MIFQTYQTFQEFNQTGLKALFTYPAQVVPMFIPLMLFSLFIIATLATFFSQKRLTGRADFFASMVSASLFVTVISFIMLTVEGLINTEIAVISFVITLILAIILIISRNF